MKHWNNTILAGLVVTAVGMALPLAASAQGEGGMPPQQAEMQQMGAQQGGMPMMRGMPMMYGQQGAGMPPMMGKRHAGCMQSGQGQQGGMPMGQMKQMKQQRQAMMQAHMQKMEQHLAAIEGLLQQLVDQQK